MPIYPCRCECGHEEEVYLTMAQHRDLPNHCGKQMTRVFTPHMVIEDMKAYQSPLDGKWISTRKNHRKHLREHDVIEVGNEKINPKPKFEDKTIKQDLARAYDQLTAN